jgi:hypothetical protein
MFTSILRRHLFCHSNKLVQNVNPQYVIKNMHKNFFFLVESDCCLCILINKLTMPPFSSQPGWLSCLFFVALIGLDRLRKSSSSCPSIDFELNLKNKIIFNLQIKNNNKNLEPYSVVNVVFNAKVNYKTKK